MKNIIVIFNRAIDVMTILSLLIMVILVFTNVVMRYAFDSGLAWSEEISRVAFVWVVFLGIIIGNREEEHLKVDTFISNLKGKFKRIHSIYVLLITSIILTFITLGGSQLIELTHKQGLPSTGLPTSIIYSAGVLASIIIILVSLYKIFIKKQDEGVKK